MTDFQYHSTVCSGTDWQGSDGGPAQLQGRSTSVGAPSSSICCFACISLVLWHNELLALPHLGAATVWAMGLLYHSLHRGVSNQRCTALCETSCMLGGAAGGQPPLGPAQLALLLPWPIGLEHNSTSISHVDPIITQFHGTISKPWCAPC